MSLRHWLARVVGLNHVDPDVVSDLERRVYTLTALAEERANQIAELRGYVADSIQTHKDFEDWIAKSVMGRLPIHDKEAAAKMIEAMARTNQMNEASTSNNPSGFQLKRRAQQEAMREFAKKVQVDPAVLMGRKFNLDMPSASDMPTEEDKSS